MRSALVLSLFLLNLNCVSETPDDLRDEPIEDRAWGTCDEQMKNAIALGLNAAQLASVESCCSDLGSQCDCAHPDINTAAKCEADADCVAGLECVAGWCVPPKSCTMSSGGDDGSVCPGFCTRDGEAVDCLTHLTCYDPISDLCLPCKVCKEGCGEGCDLDGEHLACPDGRVAPMHSCAQIVALDYRLPSQWVQVRNMCAEHLSTISMLKIGTNAGWSQLITNSEIPQLPPGACFSVSPNVQIPNPDLTDMAEGIGLFTKIAAKDGVWPRDYVLYGFQPNTHNLQGLWNMIDAFGFGGNHAVSNHAYREAFKVLGEEFGDSPQPCF